MKSEKIFADILKSAEAAAKSIGAEIITVSLLNKTDDAVELQPLIEDSGPDSTLAKDFTIGLRSILCNEHPAMSCRVECIQNEYGAYVTRVMLK